MTQEEAIKHFEAWAQCNYTPTRDAALMDLSALTPPTQEQVERVCGAEWIKSIDTAADFADTLALMIWAKSTLLQLMNTWNMMTCIVQSAENRVKIISLISAPPAAWP